MKLIKDDIERITTLVSRRFMAEVYPKLTKDLQNTMRQISFFWSHPLEIVNTLQELSEHPDLMFEKFPCIMLYTDIPVRVGASGDYDTCSLNIIIANRTQPNYRASDREQYNFIPILRPIYQMFLMELKNSTVFSVNDIALDAKHTYIERYYWGKESIYGNTGNITTDYLDAIQLQDLQLTLTNQCINI